MRRVVTKPNPEQLQNLAKLAAYLEALPEDYAQFDMERFCGSWRTTPLSAEYQIKECGSCACAVGHGPLAGIKAIPNESWTDYAFRVFGADAYEHQEFPSVHKRTLWWRLFDDHHPDNAHAAARRIRKILKENGYDSSSSSQP